MSGALNLANLIFSKCFLKFLALLVLKSPKGSVQFVQLQLRKLLKLMKSTSSDGLALKGLLIALIAL